ncbi:MAG TPA: hypothetical protein VFW50_14015 [Streptosporangiaceae bacterium]|nr:hypothetical protein [Streptosporangiaceae bacterium]
MRQATIRALEIRDEADIVRGLTRGDLEARILDAERAQATAPPDVSRQLRLTAQAEADTWQQATDAATRHDHAQAVNAQTLASQLAAGRQQLEAANARYELWSAATISTRETADKAKAELRRRGLARPPAGQQHQAATAAGDPWPPRRTAQLKPKSQGSVSAGHDPGGQAGRFDKLLSAAERLAADNAEREARAEYAARIEREAQAEPEPTRQAQDQAEAEP